MTDLTREDYWALIKKHEFHVEQIYDALDELPPRTTDQALEDQGIAYRDITVGTCLRCGRAKQMQCMCGAP